MTDYAAPWPDYEGNQIYAGDVIQHPSGQVGTVTFLAEEEDEEDRWRVDYGNGGSLSRLCLQVGERGRAVVVEGL